MVFENPLLHSLLSVFLACFLYIYVRASGELILTAESRINIGNNNFLKLNFPESNPSPSTPKFNALTTEIPKNHACFMSLSFVA